MLRAVPTRLWPAASAYACLETRATEPRRVAVERATGRSSVPSCKDTRRPFHVLRRLAARAARSSSEANAGRISAPAPFGVLARIDTPARLSNFSADSRLTLGRCPRSSSATSRGLTPARLASSFLLRLNCLRAVLSNGPRLSDSMSSPGNPQTPDISPESLRRQPLYVPIPFMCHQPCIAIHTIAVDTRRYGERD